MAEAFALKAAADAGMTLVKQAKIMSAVFGEGGSARSTDVAIVNRTGKKLTLRDCSQESGGFKDLPPENIQPGEVVVYRVESHGFMTGCTECQVIYDDKDTGDVYAWFTSNPYMGSNHGGDRGGVVTVRIGLGNNSTARVVLG